MNRRVFLAALALLALTPALLVAYPSVGSPAPNFALPDTALANHSLTDYQGKVVMLLFWDSGSESCLSELPMVQAMWQDYRDLGFQALCINLSQSMDTVKTYARLYSQLFLRDSGAVWDMYNISDSIPLNYVLDTAGTVVYEVVGYDDQIDAALNAEIQAYLPPTGIHEGKVEKTLSAVSVTPNPATDRALISFSLAKAGNASVRIYSSSGKLVRTVLNRTASAGNSSATWDLRDNAGQRVTNGAYFYEVTTGATVARGKVSVLN